MCMYMLYVCVLVYICMCVCAVCMWEGGRRACVCCVKTQGITCLLSWCIHMETLLQRWKWMFCFSICAAVGERNSVRRSSAADTRAQASSDLCRRTKWHQTFPLPHITSPSFVLYACVHQVLLYFDHQLWYRQPCAVYSANKHWKLPLCGMLPQLISASQLDQVCLQEPSPLVGNGKEKKSSWLHAIKTAHLSYSNSTGSQFLNE